MWVLEQPGVKAPGTANRTTFLPLKMSSTVMGFGPSLVMVRRVMLGRASPTLMVMVISDGGLCCGSGQGLPYPNVPWRSTPALPSQGLAGQGLDHAADVEGLHHIRPPGEQRPRQPRVVHLVDHQFGGDGGEVRLAGDLRQVAEQKLQGRGRHRGAELVLPGL